MKRALHAFYRNLKAGSNKDIALQQAKQEFLAACKSPALANPYYWAGLIGVGAMHRIRG
ncbi:MAG: CHAT domain-containing protein [Saprospiraceae bacterium]|nr:CHAT domain-containing protein [Saprospiraceae bacterium]